MENKYFEVRMEIEAPDEDTLDRWIDGMPHADKICDFEIIDPDKPQLEARIRYVEDWDGRGEYYVFENKWSNEDEWGLEVAYKLQGDTISYEALTQIRQWKKLGIPFHFC